MLRILASTLMILAPSFALPSFADILELHDGYEASAAEPSNTFGYAAGNAGMAASPEAVVPLGIQTIHLSCTLGSEGTSVGPKQTFKLLLQPERKLARMISNRGAVIRNTILDMTPTTLTATFSPYMVTFDQYGEKRNVGWSNEVKVELDRLSGEVQVRGFPDTSSASPAENFEQGAQTARGTCVALDIHQDL